MKRVKEQSVELPPVSKWTFVNSPSLVDCLPYCLNLLPMLSSIIPACYLLASNEKDTEDQFVLYKYVQINLKIGDTFL